MPEPRTLSIAGKLAISAAVWCGLALVVTGFLLVSLFDRHNAQQFDQQLHDHLIQLVAQSKSVNDSISIGQLSNPLFSKPFSGWSWQVRRGEKILAQSSSLGPLTTGALPLNAPLDISGDFQAPGKIESRGLSREVTLANASSAATFAVAGPVAELRTALGDFRDLVALTLLVLCIGLIVTVFVLIRTGLQPLRVLRQKVASMREGNEQQPTQWPRELAPVADELDELQTHNERLVTRARAQAADLAHALKTPLSVLGHLAARLPEADAEPLRHEVTRISAHLDRHLSRSRVAGKGHRRTAVTPIVEDVLFALKNQLDERNIKVHTRMHPDAMFTGDEADLYEIIGNLMDNACKWAHAQIHVGAQIMDGELQFAIADDGPGVPPDKRQEIMTRGTRLDETVPGHGLGLSIVRDIVGLYGGTIDIQRSELGGAKILVSVPGSEQKQAQSEF